MIVGSNGGADTNPAWLANLAANESAEIQIRGERRKVRSRRATSDERSRLWPELKRWDRNYAHYETKTTREIPAWMMARVHWMQGKNVE